MTDIFYGQHRPCFSFTKSIEAVEKGSAHWRERQSFYTLTNEHSKANMVKNWAIAVERIEEAKRMHFEMDVDIEGVVRYGADHWDQKATMYKLQGDDRRAEICLEFAQHCKESEHENTN